MLIRRIVSLAVALLAAASIAVTAAGAATAATSASHHFTPRAEGASPAVRVLPEARWG